MDAFERSCVALAYAGTLDQKYEKLFAYLQDDITRKTPSTALAVQLFLPGDSTMEEYISRFFRRDTFTALLTRSGWRRDRWSSAPRCWSFSAPVR